MKRSSRSRATKRSRALRTMTTVPPMKRYRARAIKRSRARRTMRSTTDLIPGLPDCLALQCLFRLPFHAIVTARAVCRRWKHELASPSFYRIRRAAGLSHRVAALLLRGKRSATVGKLHLLLYEPATGVCMMRQLAANRTHVNKSGHYGVVIGQELVVIGGWDMSENRRTSDVHIYDLLSGAWRLATPKPAPEQFFMMCGFHGGKVLVISRRHEVGSALAYDVAADTWIEMLDLGQITYQGTSIDDGSFCDKFWQSREEYNDAFRHIREMLLLEDVDDLSFLTTEDEKEIMICRYGREIRGERDGDGGYIE